MPMGPSPASEPNREEIEQRLREAVDRSRAEMREAVEPAVRAAAAARLRVAVQALMDFTLHKPRG
jgi:hypothetical protein